MPPTGENGFGNWLQFSGSNVGLDMRKLRLDHRTQGNWGYFVEFSQIPRYSPYTVNTGLAGIGTGNIAVTMIAHGIFNLNSVILIYAGVNQQ